jgi:hypothetical protein
MNYIITSNAIVLFLDNKPMKFEKGSNQYAKIIEAFDLPESQQEAAVRKAIEKTAERAEKNGFKISPEEVSYKGEILPQALADKVRSIHREGLPLNLFEKFWMNIQDNPSASSVRELYEFLAYKELPITEDGCFLAYKGLESDFWSISGNKQTKVVKGIVNASGHILNTVGAEIEVKRRDVDDNRDHHCSFGLHVGSLDYARGFAPVVDEDNEPVESESVKTRSEFVQRVADYLTKKSMSGEASVSVRKIQNSFSPEYPSKNRVLDALDELGYYWTETDDGTVVDLED